MSYFVAFPAYLLDELLAGLHSDLRARYAPEFVPIVGDLVWIRQDAENAIESALLEADDPRLLAWYSDTAVRETLVDRLMEWEDEALTIQVNEQLQEAAHSLIEQRLLHEETG